MQITNTLQKAIRFILPQTIKSTCPHCQHVGPVDEDFGWRRMGNGIMRAQSWCRECRSSTGGHSKARRPVSVALTQTPTPEHAQ